METPFKDKDSTEAEWTARRMRMAAHREQFETLWTTGMQRFFQGILKTYNVTSRRIYDSLYEQYDLSLFSREGLRFTDLKYPLIHSIALRGLAAELANKPKVNFVALGSNDPSKTTAFKHLFDQVLYEMDADQEDFEIFLDRRILGSAAVMVLTEEYEMTVKDPVFKGEKMTYEEKTKASRQTLYKKIDLRNLYLDEHCKKTSLADCSYLQVDELYAKDEFLQRFAKYGEATIDAAKVLEIDSNKNTNPFIDQVGVEWVRVTHCFDRVYDAYHVLGNGHLLNDVGNPIPRIAGRKGKELPVALAIMYKIPNAPYGYGDPHVTTAFNSIKDMVRLMILELTQKSAKPTMAVDPMSPFDEQGFDWGQDFIRVAPNDLHEIKMNADLDILYKLDELNDNDIIRATGININDTSNTDMDETARKTVIRRESQNAIIELGMNYLSASFFKRLYTLMKDDIRLHYSAMLKNGDELSVRTKDVKLTRAPGKKGGFKEEKVVGYRYFDLEPGDFDFDMELDLEIANISTSRELEKAIQQEGLEKTQFAPQGFDQAGLAKYIQEVCDMPETVLAGQTQNISSKDPKELANEGLDPSFLPDTQTLTPPQDAQATQEAMAAQQAGQIQQGQPGQQPGQPTGPVPGFPQ